MIAEYNVEPPARIFEAVIAAVRAAVRLPLPAAIRADSSLVLDLGFDSMSIARLAITLADQLAQPIFLNEWIERKPDPTDLTVGSLCAYVASLEEAA